MTVEVIINIYVISEKMDYVVDKLKLLSEVVDLYEVTGESDIIILVRTEDINSFREFLKNRLMKIDGVRSTVTSVVLHKHKREGVVIEV